MRRSLEHQDPILNYVASLLVVITEARARVMGYWKRRRLEEGVN